MKVTRVEQHVYIKIVVLREINAMGWHSRLVEALGNKAFPYHTVVRWIGKFQQGLVSTSDEQRSGRPVSVRTDLARAVNEQLMDYIKYPEPDMDAVKVLNHVNPQTWAEIEPANLEKQGQCLTTTTPGLPDILTSTNRPKLDNFTTAH
ncbi:uncharacterized protein TNCV_1064041 [Trichonephila clavipes]|nr:uncharacterized protein TNCV_1064041 [Trichonephila clavipes]